LTVSTALWAINTIVIPRLLAVPQACCASSLLIDSLDVIEPQVWDATCTINNWRSIESFVTESSDSRDNVVIFREHSESYNLKTRRAAVLGLQKDRAWELCSERGFAAALLAVNNDPWRQDCGRALDKRLKAELGVLKPWVVSTTCGGRRGV
jgi:hypothetical protein